MRNSDWRDPAGRRAGFRAGSLTRALLRLESWSLVICLAVLCWLAGNPSYAGGRPSKADPDLVQVAPFPVGGDFRLRSARGPETLDSLRGQVVLLFFGYITCPDVCPTTLGTLQQATARLTPEEQSQLRIAFVSLDPERDTPAILKDYVAAFPVPALGLTGSRAQIDAMVERYGAQYFRVALPGSGMGYGIDHSAAVYLLDQRGRLRLLLRHTASPARFADEIRRLLRKPVG